MLKCSIAMTLVGAVEMIENQDRLFCNLWRTNDWWVRISTKPHLPTKTRLPKGWLFRYRWWFVRGRSQILLGIMLRKHEVLLTRASSTQDPSVALPWLRRSTWFAQWLSRKLWSMTTIKGSLTTTMATPCTMPFSTSLTGHSCLTSWPCEQAQFSLIGETKDEIGNKNQNYIH